MGFLEPITPHVWRYIEDINNGMHLWKCDRCGSETWTNVGQGRNPPGTGALQNSRTYADCDMALIAVINDEKTFGQYDSDYMTDMEME